MSGGFKIGDGYIEVHLKYDNAKDLSQLKRQLDTKDVTKKVKLDVDSKDVDKASRSMQTLRGHLDGIAERNRGINTKIGIGALIAGLGGAGVGAALGAVGSLATGIGVVAAAFKSHNAEATKFRSQLAATKTSLKSVEDASAKAMFPGFTKALKDANGLLPTLNSAASRTGKILGDTASRLGDLFKSDKFKANLDGFLRATEPVTAAVGNMFTTLSAKAVEFGAKMAPASQGFATFLNDVTTGVAGMLTSMEPYANDFKVLWEGLGGVIREIGPVIGQVAGEMARTIGPALQSTAGFIREHKAAIETWVPIIGKAAVALGTLKIASAVAGWLAGPIGTFARLGGAATTAAGGVGGFATKMGLLKTVGGAVALGGIAVAMDQINASSQQGNLSGWNGELHDMARILTGDWGNPIADIGAQLDQVNTKWQTGQAPVQQWAGAVGQAATTAGQSVQNFFRGLVGLPPLPPIDLSVDPTKGRAGVTEFVGGISRTRGTLGLDLNTATAEQKAAAMKSHIDSLVGMAKVDANAAPGTAKADQLKAHIDGITALMKADADTSPGTAAGDALQQHINGLVAIMTADANNAPGTAKGDALKAHIDALIGIMQADADSAPGTAKANALKAFIDRLRGTVTANAETAAAEAALARLARDRTSTVYVHTVGGGANANDGGAGRTRASHGGSGGLVAGFAGGGFAGGIRHGSRGSGMVISGYAPGVDDVPAVLSRGESVLVPELTRALGAGRILAANREASGGRPASVVGSVAGMMDGTIGRRFSGGGLVKPGMGGFAGGGIQGGPRSYMMDEWMAASYKAAKLDPGSDKGKRAAAQKQLIDALRTEKEAWLQLTQARKDAARALEDLREKVSDYAIDAEDADIAVDRSYERLQAVMKDRGATALDKREAQNAYRSALERQKDMAEQHARDVKDLRDAEGKGVEGSALVLDAKDSVVVGKAGTAAAKVNIKTTDAEIKKAKAEKKKQEQDKKKADAEAKKNKSKSFDSGGIAAGRGVLSKLTARPERVLSPNQTIAFERLVAHLERQGRPAAPGRGVRDVHVHIEQRSGSPSETARMTALALRSIG